MKFKEKKNLNIFLLQFFAIKYIKKLINNF